MASVQQLFSLEGQTALVTGGTRGIGQAMAIALAEAGADILLVQRDESNQTTREAIQKLGRKAEIYTADLASRDSVSALVKKVVSDETSAHTCSPASLINSAVEALSSTLPRCCLSKVDLQYPPLSNEWAAKGINVNGIAPGYIATEMNDALMKDKTRSEQIMARIPAGRWGKPEDFKGPVVFLASRASGYVSGEILTVDGSWMASTFCS
ncbi:NAD(P)-binding protein, partial [Aureobasidium melanogenum]